MPNVASLELCKELYELSAWNDCYWFNAKFSLNPKPVMLPQLNGEIPQVLSGELEWKQPAYDLGYLLRKLPITTQLFHERKGWSARAYNMAFWSKEPEDAACKLAIELFKQGVLNA